MSKTNITGNAFVITSSAKLEDLKSIERYRPKDLTLFEEDDGTKYPVFAIGTAPCGYGDISKNGVVFSAKNDEGFAEITGFIPAEKRDSREEWFTDHYGAAILSLNKLEAKLGAAIEEINSDLAEVAASIEVVG